MDWDYQIARVLPKMFLVFFLGMIYWSLMAYLGSRNPSKNLKVYPQLNFWGQAALIFAVMFGGLLFVDKKTKDLIKQNRIVAKALACFMVLSNISVSIWQMYNNIHLLENGNLEELKILIRYRIGVLFGTGENVFDYYIHRPLWFTITTIGYAIYIFNFKRSDSRWFTKLRKAIGLLFLPAVIFMTSYFIEGWNFYDILFKLLNILILYLLLATYTWKKKKINDKTTITNDKVVKDEIVNEIITPNTKDKMIDTAEQNKEEIDIKELIKQEEVVNIEIEESQATANKPQTTPNEKPKKKKKKTWKKVLIGLGIIVALFVIGTGIYYYIDMKRSEESWKESQEIFDNLAKKKIINRSFFGVHLGDSVEFKAKNKKVKYTTYKRSTNCTVYVFENTVYGAHKFDYIALKTYKNRLIEVIMIEDDVNRIGYFCDIHYELYGHKLWNSIEYYKNFDPILLFTGGDWYGGWERRCGPHFWSLTDDSYVFSDGYTCIEAIGLKYFSEWDFYNFDNKKISHYYENEVGGYYKEFWTNHEDLIQDLCGISGIFSGCLIRYFDIDLCEENIKSIETEQFLINSQGF